MNAVLTLLKVLLNTKFFKKKHSATKEKEFSKYISYNENKHKKIEIIYYTNIISNNYLIFNNFFKKYFSNIF